VKLSDSRTSRALLLKIAFIFVSAIHFCQTLSKLQGLFRQEELDKLSLIELLLEPETFRILT
jgi:hypothetical protein